MNGLGPDSGPSGCRGRPLDSWRTKVLRCWRANEVERTSTVTIFTGDPGGGGSLGRQMSAVSVGFFNFTVRSVS